MKNYNKEYNKLRKFKKNQEDSSLLRCQEDSKKLGISDRRKTTIFCKILTRDATKEANEIINNNSNLRKSSRLKVRKEKHFLKKEKLKSNTNLKSCLKKNYNVIMIKKSALE